MRKSADSRVGSERLELPVARDAVRPVLQPEEWPQPTPLPWVQLMPRTTIMSAAWGIEILHRACPSCSRRVSGPSALG